MTDPRVQSLVDECSRQEENCRYTGVSLYTWQKSAQRWRAGFLVAPILLAGIATSQILGTTLRSDWAQAIAALLSLTAGFFPSIYIALNMDMRVSEISRSAGEFTNLRDRFRQISIIRRSGPFEEFQAEFEALMDRLDAARASAPPAPDWCFKEAQTQIKAGHYTNEVDEHPAS